MGYAHLPSLLSHYATLPANVLLFYVVLASEPFLSFSSVVLVCALQAFYLCFLHESFVRRLSLISNRNLTHLAQTIKGFISSHTWKVQRQGLLRGY